MLRRCCVVLFLLVLPASSLAVEQPFYALCYHEVREDTLDRGGPDRFAVSTDKLITHFTWLRAHGYHPIGVEDLIAARDGRKPLPAKPVLLTFDDGYASVYTHVYPLLKLFRYPALVALVGSWLEIGPEAQVPYGDERLPRSRFLSWDQIRELQSSGLVEFASHTHDLHQGVLGNPQGNLLPAAGARIYDPETRRYETDAQYRQRIRADLKTNSDLMARELGKRPRVLVWPYGRYNQVAVDLARTEGMPITFTTAEDSLPHVHGLAAAGRFLIDADAPIADLVDRIFAPQTRKPPLRVAQVDLDYLYDLDPAQRERNLGLLLDRIKAMQISTVFLQAFADPDGDGTASALYFPNRHLPMRADLFNRVAWQLHTRARVSVYAWMPVLAFDLRDAARQRRLQVRSDSGDKPSDYRRLSPFHSETRTIVGEIYEDLAAHGIFDGLLFHDDAYLSDHEDAHPAALNFYETRGLPRAIAEIRADPIALRRWTRLKTRALIDFTRALADRVRVYQPQIKTARNLYAQVVQAPESESWFAQSLPEFVQSYDFTALMAMPYMEGADSPDAWLGQLLDRVAALPGGLDKTIFELQSRDWRNNRDIPTATLVSQMEMLLHKGGQHIGYYPEDFIRNHPALPAFMRGISRNDYPFLP